MLTIETHPYWLSTTLPRFPALENNIYVDVAVIGGGMTGITTAYLLKKAGRTVALLEKDALAASNTCRTTAHLTYVTDLRLAELVKRFGKDAAKLLWSAGQSAIQFIEELVAERNIDCGFQRVPGFLYGRRLDRSSERSLEEEARLAMELGFPATFVRQAPIFETPSVCYSGVAKFDPRKYLASLLDAIPGGGSHVFEQSEAEAVVDKPLHVKANGHTVSCGDVVIATHVPLMGKSNIAAATLLQSKLALYTSYVVGARIPRGIAPEALFWQDADPYDYLRVDSHPDHGYAIFGGADHKTGQTAATSDRFEEVEKSLLGALPDAQVDARWSGQLVETSDGLPFVGETSSRQLVATGFSGNGLTFGTVSAWIILDALLGRRNPWAELFSVGRTTLKGGAWDYLKENLDYPYYMVRDRLKRPEGHALTDVQPGEGKILSVKGERVAAHRDESGKLSCVSAVCTHMGCLVRWNDAERTWDCPCHGSRFQPDGQVVSGPAEAPLRPMPAT